MGKASVAGSYIGTHVIEASVSTNAIQSGDDSAGQIYSVYIDNTANNEAMYLKMFETASPTLGVKENADAGTTGPDSAMIVRITINT